MLLLVHTFCDERKLRIGKAQVETEVGRSARAPLACTYE